MRVAVVHDWLNGMRGGERVLEALLELYPSATVYTLFHERGKVSPLIESRPIVTSVAGSHTGNLSLLPQPASAVSFGGGIVESQGLRSDHQLEPRSGERRAARQLPTHLVLPHTDALCMGCRKGLCLQPCQAAWDGAGAKLAS